MGQIHKRFTAEQVTVLLKGYCQGILDRSAIEETLGISRPTFFLLLKEYRRNPDEFSLVYHRKTPTRIPAWVEKEIEAAVAYAKTRPRDGYRRLAWMMVDAVVVYLSPSTVYRILDSHDLLYRWKRPEPGEGRQVPEAHYTNEAWHIDLMYLWVRGRWYFLVSILDSYSRYIVHWELALSMRDQEIAEIIATALERVPRKSPEPSGTMVLSLSPRSGERSYGISSWKRFPSG